MNHEGRIPDSSDLKAHADALNATAKASEHLATAIDQAPGKAVNAAKELAPYGAGGVGGTMLLWFLLKLLLIWLAGKK